MWLQVWNRIVVEMMSLNGIMVVLFGDSVLNGVLFVEVMGGVFWVDVLKVFLEYRFVFRLWIDYFYFIVGGILLNVGVSGQIFCYGLEVSNVLQFEVVIGIYLYQFLIYYFLESSLMNVFFFLEYRFLNVFGIKGWLCFLYCI